MYYYSFLNLAKAFISISDTAALTEFVGHGLTLGKFSKSELSKQAIYTKGEGVFQKYFFLQTGRRLPPKYRLSLPTLLSYCSDIKFEYEQSGLGKHKLLPTQTRCLVDKNTRSFWPVLAVTDFSKLTSHKRLLKKFWEYFEVIEPDGRIKEAFDLTYPAFSYFTFLQSRKTYSLSDGDVLDIPKLKTDVLDACGYISDAPVYNDDFDFSLIVPLKGNSSLVINQSTAIYAAMFYVGSLVRYRPDYLEQLLSSTDAWLIERFVRSCSGTFLRYISNMILGTDHIYSAR